MYLEKIEIQGFKSFASKEVLAFPRPDRKSPSILKDDSKAAPTASCGITCIVGPNGSGKSNIVDSVRWVLGEQSLKSLRGKKSQDVIFAGSDKKGRLGMASVSLHINNQDKALDIDYEEVVISRKLYRNGESEYLINNHKARLQDVIMLAAKANFGQKSYSIVSQGSIDQVILATPSERKEYFDDAVGVKSFQIKRDQSINKLENAWNNLRQVDALLIEIKPRLTSLARQVKRLEKREKVEAELKEVQHKYYGWQWHSLEQQITEVKPKLEDVNAQLHQKHAALQKLQQQLNSLEKQDSRSQQFNQLQKDYQAAQDKKNKLREQQLMLENQIEWAKEKVVERLAPLPMPEIIQQLKAVEKLDAKIDKALASGTPAQLAQAKEDIKELGRLLTSLIDQLEKPRTKERQRGQVDPQAVEKLAIVVKELPAINAEIEQLRSQMEDLHKKEEEQKGEFFAIQRQLSAAQNEYNTLANKASEIRVEMARLETRQQDLKREVTDETGSIDWLKDFTATKIDQQELHSQMMKLRHQLELIGGVDPETVEEYNKVKERYEFLDEQAEDLRTSINKLEKVITELDEQIQLQFDIAFKNINKEFTKFFKILFDGGKAELRLLKEEQSDEQSEEKSDNEQQQTEPSLLETLTAAEEKLSPKKFLQKRIGKVISGIEITATPPGKKVSSIGMLSGGERSLASIALICAVIANNPSPFVILDEVDAALDEANSQRFAKILVELAHKTQFIVITHNRATMYHADVLYGVTMNDDSTSKLLSIKMEDAEKIVRQ